LGTRYIDVPLVRSDEGEKLTISGFASVETEDRHGTIIRSDGLRLASFKKNPTGFFEHGNDPVIGATPVVTWDVNSITIRKNDDGVKGLFMSGVVLEDTEEQKKVASFIRQESVRFLSIGFRDSKSEWLERADGSVVESLVSAELLEVSPVTIPSNMDSGIESVSTRMLMERIDILEKALLGGQEELSQGDYDLAERVVMELNRIKGTNHG
jgi:HK97 family phage prohead protease